MRITALARGLALGGPATTRNFSLNRRRHLPRGNVCDARSTRAMVGCLWTKKACCDA
eukprot:CAMPEP_0176139770 /NCGR_PEP_ID=MMETSP0120_2-20121206/71028_1 /TAXON_ID=160619 /ORGANISM="Kryptoperidinium foliaceum, Strain CCMP 1326" /LENGTH=56 /DNA_ID=CAMNT_0017475789 /DNA_START=14 /DNA_END=184 /DNA_ORIENTATION=-